MVEELLGLGVEWVKYWTNFLYQDYLKQKAFDEHQKRYPLGDYPNPEYEEERRRSDREGYYAVPLNPYGPGGNLEEYRRFQEQIKKYGKIKTDRNGNPIIVPLKPANIKIPNQNIPLVPLVPASLGNNQWPRGLKIRPQEVGVYEGKYTSNKPIYNRGPDQSYNPAFGNTGGFT